MVEQRWLQGIVLLLALQRALAFKPHDFKKCQDAGFCQRLRGVGGSQYSVSAKTVSVSGPKLAATLSNDAEGAQLALAVTSYAGIVRVSVDETAVKDRYQVLDVLMPGLDKQALPWSKYPAMGSGTTVTQGDIKVALTYNPFGIEVQVGNKPALSLNPRRLFHFEHRRPKPSDPATSGAGAWEETFNGHTDSKRQGPEAISLDLSFPGFDHVYGLPERATSLALKPTASESGPLSEPYRLYNLDVFEYEDQSPFGLYGAVPLMLAHKPGLTVGAFWLNAAEQFVDLTKIKGGTAAQWIAESGILDLFVLTGPTPKDVLRQYATLTGTGAMPQYFALGYHQCRWNYKDEADTRAVDAGFEQHAIPYDVIWLDIEHTDGKRYMTWDSRHFPEPAKLQNDIAAHGRKTVTIVDPHVKRDSGYYMHAEAEKLGYYVKNKDGGDFDGWCWPGSSSYLDVTSPDVRHWWAQQFALDKYQGSTKNLYIWNDMNEPSVFNGPEITMPKDAVHYGQREHRDVHNVFGMYYHMATADGLALRGQSVYGKDGDRPFVLSRAFFSGTQRVGPIWTGDNTATWSHLKVSVPMLLTLGMTGITFSGADVGGFFGNPDPELLVRWYQLGAYYPFFRGHAHLETQRREPWLFGEAATARIRTAIRSRYALLPYIYTLFRAANTTGEPIMRPLWYEFPANPDTFSVDEEFMLGPGLLVAPVLSAGVNHVDAFLPRSSLWYDGATGAVRKKGTWLPGLDQIHRLQVTLDGIPTFYRGGHVVVRRERPRRSTDAQKADPFTLVVALDLKGEAQGELYLDDGHSFAFTGGNFLHREFRFAGGQLSNSQKAKGSFSTSLQVERIVFLGLQGTGWAARLGSGGGEQPLEPGAVALQLASGAAQVLRQPNLKVGEDWTLVLSQKGAAS